MTSNRAQVAMHVLFALFVREMQTRGGARSMGYVWVVLEPVAHIAVLLTLFTVTGLHSGHTGQMAPFIALGVLSYLLFRQIAEKGLSAFDSNRSLFAYKQVLPVDAVLARTLLETVLVLAVVAVGVSAAVVLDQTWAPGDPLIAVAALALLVIFSLGIAMAASVLSVFSHSGGRVFLMFIRPLYFLSGVFYSVSALPSSAQELLWLNPLAHAIELMREGLLSNYTAPGADLAYLAACAMLALVLGLALQAIGKERMLARD
jgi:capsular polysaccharide transport system permease protein